MVTTICPSCKTRPVADGRYMCGECEDQMTGRARSKPSGQETPPKSALRCGKCGSAIENADPFCPVCGTPRPRGASGQRSSAQAPPGEDRTYQDPLFVGGVYHCPKCNSALEAGVKRCSVCGVMFMNPVPQASKSSASQGSTNGDAHSDLYCHKCGKPMNSQDVFCPACGAGKTKTNAPGPMPSAPNTDGFGEGSKSSSGPAPMPKQPASAPQDPTTSTVQRIVSKPWFLPAWNGLGAIWSLGITVLALCGIWIMITSAVHYFQGAGLNGVYEASDGGGDVTFWSDGTYLFSSMGIQLPGKYKIRNNGTVDMMAQYNAAVHPAANASQDDQMRGGFLGIFASGIGDGVLSSDKNTFEWQGHAFSYDHKPATGPPAAPDPNAPETGDQQSGAASAN